mgnify:CR=1 FL=1|jgi:hypothetical protein
MLVMNKNKNKYLSLMDSFKDVKLNRILDKISNNTELDSDEILFLKKYDTILDSDIRDYSMLSKNVTYETIKKILSKNRIICDLCDKDGKINDDIIGIENDYESDRCILQLKKQNEYYLYDNFLYNINYKINKGYYSLTSQDEYYEKLLIENDN